MNEKQEKAYSRSADFGWEFDYKTDEGDIIMARYQLIGDARHIVASREIDKEGNTSDYWH